MQSNPTTTDGGLRVGVGALLRWWLVTHVPLGASCVPGVRRRASHKSGSLRMGTATRQLHGPHNLHLDASTAQCRLTALKIAPVFHDYGCWTASEISTMSLKRKTVLTAKHPAVDELGEEWLVFEYTTFVREELADHCWSMWEVNERTFVCDGHHIERLSATAFRVTRTGAKLVSIAGVLEPQSTLIH